MPALLLTSDGIAVLVSALVTRASAWQFVACVLTLTAFAATLGLYRSKLAVSFLDDLPKLFSAWCGAAAAVLALDTFGSGDRDVMFVAAVAVTLSASRMSCYQLARGLRASGRVAHRTLILGATPVGKSVAHILSNHPVYGLQPVGFLESGYNAEHVDRSDLPVVGAPHELAHVVEDLKISVAVVAYDEVKDTELVPLIRSCHRLRCELFLIPHLSELHSMSDSSELIWGIPMVRLKRAAHRTPAWRFKRLLDIAVAAGALLALAPLLVAISVAVRLEGGPGIIFRQTRVGIDGRTFDLFKFRSLRPADEAESQTHWNISHDDRLGPVGRFLRKASLDELPQLVNILRGEMSLVGPRPERPHFVQQFRGLYPSYGARDRVPSGLTGWAQVHGLRGDTPVDQRAEFDNFYIENWSLWLDVKILLKTVSSVFSAPGS